jgi:hypothetical protein
MKKITLMVFALVAFCWQSYAQFTESFETEIPATWTVLNEASTPTWVWDDSPSGAGGAQDGNAVARISFDGVTAHDDYLVTPAITVTAGVNDRISFWVQSRSGTFLESYEVRLSTATPTAADFTTVLQAETTAPTTWTQLVFDLTGFVGQTVYVAIRATGFDEFELYADNFVNDAFVTDTLDFFNLQFPATGTITLNDEFLVFAQAFESGLTDVSDTPAAGIEAWIGYSTVDSSPDTDSDWTWVTASTNPGFDFSQNNDEYTLDLGAEVGDGTFYYASRWRLNGGPFTYGGILPDGSNGGEWGVSGNASGILTVNLPPAPTNDTFAGAIPIVPSSEGTGCATFNFINSSAGDGTTDSGLDGSCNGADTGLDRFYSWTATTDALIWNDGAGNPGIVIRDAATEAEITCSGTFAADDTVLSGWTIGQNLVIQVYDFGAADVDTSFCLEALNLPPAPDNDNCAGVIDLGTLTSPLTATTEFANNDFGQDCLTNPGAPDIVYSILVPDGQELTIGQTSNAYNSKHRVAYGATCPGDVLIACVDDPDVGDVIWLNDTGSDQTVYWIQSAFSTASGEFTLAWSVNVPCDADAGTLTADANPVELNGTATISATEDVAPVVPTGFTTLYVLTSGAGLLIEQTNATPSFDVTVAGDYTIHTLVYDPNTLDPGSLPPGATGFDVNALLIQGGGTICGALDVAGAPITVSECIADAGTLTADSSQVLLDGTTTISATEDTAPVVPAGFTTLYVLTSGAGLLIEQANATPSFDVTVAGDYTIHTLVYDPNTLDPGSLPPGATGFDVNALLIQGGGTICGALDVAGAPISVLDPASLEELLIVDLSTPNEVTVVATAGLSSATVTGADGTGIYFADFFASAGTQAITNNLVSGDLTSAADNSDGSPNIFRGGGGTDVGLNIWSYTDTPTSSFTTGQVAFSGQATWTLTVDEFNAFLTAPMSGLLYFPADGSGDIPGATLIGAYSVTTVPLSVTELESNEFSYYPNPIKDVLNISSQKMIEEVDVFNMLGQNVIVQKLNTLNAQVNTESLMGGTYFVRVILEDGTTDTFKVIKN